MSERTWQEVGIVIPQGRRPNHKGEVKVHCPICKERDWSCSANVITKTWFCHRATCGHTGSLFEKGNYAVPDVSNPTALNQFAWDFLEARGISPAATAHLGLSTQIKYNVYANVNSEALVYPVLRYGKAVNVAYRRLRFEPDLSDDDMKTAGIPKSRYWFAKDCKTTLMNIDCLQNNPEELYWVEGWLDGAALQTIGITNWVSIPNGSPKEGTQDFEGRLAPVRDEWDRLNKVKRHILFLDNDAPGRTMTEALARCLSQVKCNLMQWPDREWEKDGKKIKDAGDILRILGKDGLTEFATLHYPYPLEGIYTDEEIMDSVMSTKILKPDAYTGIKDVDDLFGFVLGWVHLFTGVPNSGKSSMILDFIRRVVIEKDWKATLFCAENMVFSLSRIVIAQASGIPFNQLNEKEKKEWGTWFRRTFHVIKTTQVRSLEQLIKLNSDLVCQSGDRIFLIDPMNKLINDRYVKRMNEIEYLNWSLNLLSDHAKETQQIIIPVAHPHVITNKDGSIGQIKSYYQINGGAQWANIVDAMMTTNVPVDEGMRFGHFPAPFRTLKIREKPECGAIGGTRLWFNPDNKRYITTAELETYGRSLRYEEVSYKN